MSYPRASGSYVNLGNVYAREGQYEKAAEAYRESLRLAPDTLTPYGNLVHALMPLQWFAEARQNIQQAQARRL